MVDMIGIAELLPYARNSRTHSDGQIAKVAASIREFGFTNPVLIMPDRTIVAGHARVEAARVLGLGEVPCRVVGEHWTKAQLQAYIIADNKLALDAGWDIEMLKVEIDDLMAADFNVELTGFSEHEMEALLNGWNVEPADITKDGENLDGITSTIRVRVDQDEGDLARSVITKALDAAGLTYELA
jgi:ParB-like chromosome segregation protein Spo0J